MKPSRHRSRLLAIPTCWFTRFSPLFSIKAGVLSQLQMFNSSIECLATDPSPLSSRLLRHPLLKSPLALYLRPLLYSALHSPIFSTSSIWFISCYCSSGNLSLFPSRVDNDVSFVLSFYVDHEICILAPHWSWNMYSRSTLIPKFVLSLHIDS